MSIEDIIKPSELNYIQPYTELLKERLTVEKDVPPDIVARNFAEEKGLKEEVVKKYCRLLLIANNQKTLPLYQEPLLGDNIEIEILDVRSYGYLVTTLNGQRGLVHISEIAEEFIEFPEDYARIGDKHLAKVIMIDEKGLSLSFKALGGLKPVYRSGDMQQLQPKPPIQHLQVEGKKLISLVLEALGGKLSVRAEHEFMRLIRDYGIVDTTLKLQDTLRDLDNGVILAKIVENKINGAYIEYIASSHSIDAYIDRVEPNKSRIEAEKDIIYKCENGQKLFDNGLIRIIQHGDLAFPCVSDLNGWIIKTTLFYRMIANKTIEQLTKEYY